MRHLALILISLITLGCQPEKKAPQQRIDDPHLISLLVELHLQAAEHASGSPADIMAKGTTPFQYQSVLAKENVAETDYHETILFMSEHPDHLVSLYDSVIERLTALQSEAQR